MALTLPALLLLGGTELLLRLMHFGYPTSFFKPATINGVPHLVENDRFGLRFFPPELARSPAPVTLRLKKPPGTCRIFLFGESAALGDPAPAFGAGRYLQALLRRRFPDTDFEVVCVAMTAINSHAILPIARECARLDGDLWIIYAGNNEMVGPFGAATVFGQRAVPWWVVRPWLAWEQTRLHQALNTLLAKWRRPGGGRTWEGMKLFTRNTVAPDHPAREVVYASFRANLADILRAGEDAGVPIILSTVAVNLKDLPPFASLPTRANGTNLPAEFKELLARGTVAEQAQDWPAAIRAYEAAASLSPGHAETHFRLGRSHLALTNLSLAQAAFSRARDADALPFRTDSRMNAIIADAARTHAARGVHLVDAAALFATRSPVGIPGNESFFEHVHLHFDGNYHLARALAERVADLLPSAFKSHAVDTWATQDQCDRDLGLTDWNRRDVFAEVLRRLTQPPFDFLPDNPARRRHWQTALEAVKQRITTTNIAPAREVYLEAIHRQPDDFRLHWNFAEFLEATGDVARAIAEWQQVAALIPQHHVPPYQVGRLLAAQGRMREARESLRHALELRPDLAAGWWTLASISFAEGSYEEALQHWARARALLPQDPRIPYESARTLVRLKRSTEAMAQAREALKLDQDFWEARALLGEELAFAGREDEARREFEAVLRLNPNHARTRLNLGVNLLKQGHREHAEREFQAALRLDPQMELARRYLNELNSQSPAPPATSPAPPPARPTGNSTFSVD